MTAAEITRLTVHVQPNAGNNRLVDFKEGILRVKISASPVEGKANRELVDFLSDCLGIRKSDINIEKGFTGRNKVITISGFGHEKLVRILKELLTPDA
jgi:uncharacterized protein